MDNTNLSIPRMRTISELAELVKKEDPKTKISKSAIRRFVITGQLQHVRVGNKYLISVDAFKNFLEGRLHSEAEEGEREE